ncbi:hypothetical protein BJ973_004127 [Actinoplanes tereljensis]|uniref:Uncharacterized protein n=1 Tax=Paractinoplanes tereljensis TaxID=571912 RepID=A0A919NU11_9ACTN|nr:hypothetical protein [Actinoplanes tereljensis]GIF23517.1 hypothetical protein Ate02nite_62470 [Actinoplanes tereljensis]
MQLHDLVDAVTADEPPMLRTADDIVAAGRRAQRRRRTGFASAGAAGLVLVAVAGAFVLRSSGVEQKDGTTAAATTTAAAPSKAAEAQWVAAEPFTFTFQGYDVGKFHVQNPIVASTAYQIASIYEDGRTTNDKSVPASEITPPGKDGKRKPTLYAYLTVYRPGAFDPSKIKGGKALVVDGHKAVQATLPVGLDPKNPADPGNKAFAWEYADKAWAAVTSVSSDDNDPSFANLSTLVAGLKPSTPKPAALPFTVGYVPSGYQPVQIGIHALPGLNGIAAARDGDFGGATYAKPAPATTGLGQPFENSDGFVENSFSIYVTPSHNSNQKAQAGKAKCYAGGFCNVWSADGKVQVQVSAEGTGANLPSSELQKIAGSIKVADVADESTWTPAATALRQ